MSFFTFFGFLATGFLIDEFVRFSMDETSIFTHKKSATNSHQAELHNHYNNA